MAKTLVISEKPSVARDIVKVLGGFTEEDGYFESDDWVVTFAVGHLLELLAPEDLDDKYKRWTLDTLPIIPEAFRYKAKSGQTERIRTIRKLLERDDVEGVVNACDAGREGELIFRELVEHLGSTKPTRRLWLQSMTDSAIRDGFEHLRPGEELEGLGKAAACRAYTDWLIGMNATRALTKRLKSRREKTAWSAGRVQTPTLAMLVDREFEILAHRPRPFWRVTATFRHEGNEYTAGWFDKEFADGGDEDARDDRIFDEAWANAIVEAVTGLPGTADETRKPSRESAPPLFDLTSLQREGNRRFSWSARRTLSAAQRCYERHKILTYPRTDSRCLPNDYREVVSGVLASLAGAGSEAGAEFAEYAAAAERLQSQGLQNDGRIFDDAGVSDHFAIVPTGTLPAEPLTGDDKRLYDLVVRRFLGAFHPPALWERVERTSRIGDHHFRTRARFLKEPGWRSVLPPVTEEESATLPALAPGQDAVTGVDVRNESAEAEEDETRPPARITEARLLSLMENAGKAIEDEDLAAVLHQKGLGTPATRADVIENLIAKGYALRLGKALRPTVKGIRLIDTLRRIEINGLTSPGLTGEIENHLLQVERGERTSDSFMDEMVDYASSIVDRAKTFEYDELYDLEADLGNCPACGKQMIEMAWFYRCQQEEGVEREDDCPFRMWKDTSGRYLDRATVKAIASDGKSGPLDGFTARNGRTYKGFIEIDKGDEPEDKSGWSLKVRSLGWNEGDAASDQVEYDVNPEPLGRCPFEEECNIVESPTQHICERKLKDEELGKDENRPKSCGFVMPRTVCKREITREEVLVYLKNGKTDVLTDFTSRFGRPFSAQLVLNKTGRHGFEFPPRKRKGEGDAAADAKAPAAKVTKKKVTKKKTTKKKPARKKAAAKKAPRKKVARKKAATEKAAAPKAAPSEDDAGAPRRKASSRKTVARKKASDS